RLGFSSDEFGYAIDLGLPTPSDSMGVGSGASSRSADPSRRDADLAVLRSFPHPADAPPRQPAGALVRTDTQENRGKVSSNRKACDFRLVRVSRHSAMRDAGVNLRSG